jgi:hypothetical protein
MVLVKKACKEIAKKKGVRFPDKSIKALEKKCIECIAAAAARAKANRRKTIIPADF